MVMMLPFLTGLLAVWFGLAGRRGASLVCWGLTLVLLLLWSRIHMTDSLTITL